MPALPEENIPTTGEMSRRQYKRLRLPIAAVWAALWLCCAVAYAQPISFNLKTEQGCPVSLVTYSPSVIRMSNSRRQFVTVKNISDRAVAGLLFQQTVAGESHRRIVALERVSVIFKLHETKRLSISVDDVWSLMQNAARTGEPIGTPELSIVVVEFVDGSTWNAPIEGSER